MCFIGHALLCHDSSALRLKCFLPGSFVLFFRLLPSSFVLFFRFLPGSFVLFFHFLPGSFVLFFRLLPGSFDLFRFLPGSFTLLLLSSGSFLQLLRFTSVLFLHPHQTLGIFYGLLESRLNGLDLFLLPTSHNSQPIEILPHETGHLFRTFHHMIDMLSRSRHLLVKRLNIHN